MKVLITGASGFIGRSLVRRLSARHEVFVLARSAVQTTQQPHSMITVDLARPIDWRLLPERVDIIIHLAQAPVPLPESANEMFAVNTNSTQHLLDYGRRSRARRFVLASTGDVYGRLGSAKETDAASPESFYAITKRAAEMLVESYSAYFEPCILRLFHPYGPGQVNRLIPRMADRIRQQQPVQVHRNDRPHLTPIHIDDMTRALECVLTSSYCGILNIAGDRIVSIRDLAEMIGHVVGRRPVFKDTGEETFDLIGDNRLMKEILGDWPMISLQEGLRRTLEVKEQEKECLILG